MHWAPLGRRTAACIRAIIHHLRRCGHIYLSGALLVVLAGIRLYRAPSFPNLEAIAAKDGSESYPGPVKAVVDMVIEADKYLVSLTTLLTGALVLGARAARPRQGFPLFVTCATLTCALYYGSRTIFALIEEMSQGYLAIRPGQSEVLFFLEMEFWSFLASAVCILITLLFTWRAGRSHDDSPSPPTTARDPGHAEHHHG